MGEIGISHHLGKVTPQGVFAKERERLLPGPGGGLYQYYFSKKVKRISCMYKTEYFYFLYDIFYGEQA